MRSSVSVDLPHRSESPGAGPSSVTRRHSRGERLRDRDAVGLLASVAGLQ